MELPNWGIKLIRRLEEKGFEAYAVGGCVRDMLLGKKPEDYDFAVSALPDETKQALNGVPVFDTGLRHGTVTAVVDGHAAEITTYRTESGYSDFRRPDKVGFTRSLSEDLSRRDFTVNAMAFHPERGLVDCFGGKEDLKNRILKCVGEPERRFREDALRILRCLRFSSALEFAIEEDTRQALLKHRELLKKIAPERLQAEFSKLILGEWAEQVLTEYLPVFQVFLPEAGQRRSALSWLPAEKKLRLAGVFSGCTPDETARALERLRYDGKTIRTVTTLERYRQVPLETDRRQARKLVFLLGMETAEELLRFREEPELLKWLEVICGQGLCCSLSQLSVNGEDLIRLGYPEGRGIGKALNRLLQLVLDETLENQKELLLKKAKSWMKLDCWQQK